LCQEEWRAFESREHQLVFLCAFAQGECGATVSDTVVARVFAIAASQVRKIRSKAKKQVKLPQRPLILPPDQEDAIVDLIERGVIMATLLSNEMF
jgi:hypothetical protein